MLPEPWQSLPNFFPNGSVENCPSNTYLWLVAKRCQYRLTIPLQVWCTAFWDNCFLQLLWLPAILIAILPNSMMKSSRVLFGDLISACRGTLRNLSIWKDLTFKIFHHFKTLFMKRAASFLSTLIPDWVRSASYVFSENTLRQVETRCLSIGFGAMEISFKSESLTSLSNSKRYNCLRCTHFATRLTPSSSKISSPVFTVSNKLWIFFNRWTYILHFLKNLG